MLLNYTQVGVSLCYNSLFGYFIYTRCYKCLSYIRFFTAVISLVKEVFYGYHSSCIPSNLILIEFISSR